LKEEVLVFIKDAVITEKIDDLYGALLKV